MAERPRPQPKGSGAQAKENGAQAKENGAQAKGNGAGAKGNGAQAKRRPESAPPNGDQRDWYWVKEDVRTGAANSTDLPLEIDLRGDARGHNPAGDSPGGSSAGAVAASPDRPGGAARGRLAGASTGESREHSLSDPEEYSSSDSAEYASGDSAEYASGDSAEYASGESIDYSASASVELSSGETIDFSSGESIEYASDESTGSCSDESTGGAQGRFSINELLHSIALEELAFAHLINVEAEKAQKVAEYSCMNFTPDEVIELQHSIAKVLEQAVAKEQLLFKKLRLLLHEHACHHDECT